MNFPSWQLINLGGGTLIALIAVFHVYISHLAVGGGLFIWLMDRKTAKTGNEELNGFLRKYNWIFLLVTMVFGGMTGVGIWWTIGLVSPAGTDTLIHHFVFGWAIEWVFFLGEIIALLIYHYYFDKLQRKDRTTIAFFYFVFAWLSLFVINGILSFMLTPGTWLETGNFWHGFLNPGFFPSLFFRTFITVMVAGIFAFLVGSFQKEESLRKIIARTGVQWLVIAFVGLTLSGFWYFASVPESIRMVNFDLNAQMSVSFNTLLTLSPILLLLSLLFLLKMNKSSQKIFAILISIAGLIWMGGFEYSREIARKPYVIYDYMYSTGVLKQDVEELNKAGFLNSMKWTQIHEVGDFPDFIAGEELFNSQCLACHTIGGRNDIISRTDKFTYIGMLSQLQGQGKVLEYMPPFLGTKAEMKSLAAYIIHELQGKDIVVDPAPLAVGNEMQVIPEKSDEYVLLVWNDLGMHCISDMDEMFALLPPANTLEAQLIKRGDPPEVITEGVHLEYAAPEEMDEPSKHLDFWDFCKSNYGVDLEKDVGLAGNGMKGQMHLNEKIPTSFIAEMIPATPYKDDSGAFMPFPEFVVRAVDSETGNELVSANVITPTSTEMGCRNCHGGDWGKLVGAGIAKETASNFLAAHDRLNGTTLLQNAINRKPALCQSCHADPAVGTPGVEGVMNFSSAMHGWHANYMPFDGGKACALCHPAREDGFTRCLRSIHATIGLECTDCHGTMQEHGLALVKGEEGKEAATRLAKYLKSNSYTYEEINGRIPWLNEPDCLNCHVDFQPPESIDGYNTWVEGAELFRMRHGYSEMVRCAACHGSPHALYPASNPYGKNKDNSQPMQYMGEPLPIGSNGKCDVCHTAQMDEAIHHENMNRPFRNADLLE